MLLRKPRENSQTIALLLALCLALVAQYLFTGEITTHRLDSNAWWYLTAKQTVALIILLLAIAFATWAASSQNNGGTANTTVFSKAVETQFQGNQLWLISAGVSYLLSIFLYLLVGENGLVNWLWIAGIGLLVIPLWLESRGKTEADNIPSWEWLLVGAISLIGFGLRYWKLTEIPSHVDNDVALMGTFGLDLIKAGQYNWIGFSNSQHLLSYDQFLAWSMRLFGQNHYGVVMFSVILGALSLIFIFLLGRELGGPFIGLTSIGLLTISYTHIHFSRILFGSSASFSAIIVIYSILKGLRTRVTLWFAIAGVITGWGLLLYDSSRVLPAIILSIIFWRWLWVRDSFKLNYKNWGILLTGVILGFGPMLAFALLNFSSFSGRANVVTLWAPNVWEHELAAYQTTSAIQVIWQQTWRTFLTLHLTGDGSPHFAFQRPMVSSLTALLFILGLGYSLARIKNIKYFGVLSWAVLTFIFGGVLTADPPYWPHLNIAIPAIILVAAIGAAALADKITTVFGQVGYKIYSWILVAAIIVTGITNWQIYYDFVKNNAGNRIRISRYLASLPAGYSAYMISPNWSWNEYAFRFFNRGMSGADLSPERLATDPPRIQQPTVFILYQHPELVPVLKSLYPEGIAENHNDFNNLVSFISYRVVPPKYQFEAAVHTFNPLSLPGWWLIFGILIFGAGRIAYLHYGSMQIAVIHPRYASTQQKKSRKNSGPRSSKTNAKKAEAQITIPLDIPDAQIAQTSEGKKGEIIITIESTKAGTPCRKCGKWITTLHGQDKWVKIKYRPAFGRQTYLHYRPNRYQCLDCKGHPITTQELKGVNGSARI